MRVSLCLLFIGFFLFGHGSGFSQTPELPVIIKWSNTVPGDFSFTTQWSYAENVFRNQFGQLVCNGFCPGRLDKLTDSSGRIIDDSMAVYYQILDTTHYFHTLHCTSNCSEFAGTDFIYATTQTSGTVECYTLAGVATHCRLMLSIKSDTCFASAELKSIIAGEDQAYTCTGGHVTIDPEQWKKGIIKAAFRFEFDANTREHIFWEGLILCPIK